jgi:hypothetical protein
MNSIRSIASYIPAKWRAIVYSLIGLSNFLIITWELLPAAYDGKVLATINFLGFGVAAVNALPDPPPPPPPPPNDLEEQFPNEFP